MVAGVHTIAVARLAMAWRFTSVTSASATISTGRCRAVTTGMSAPIVSRPRVSSFDSSSPARRSEMVSSHEP